MSKDYADMSDEELRQEEGLLKHDINRFIGKVADTVEQDRDALYERLRELRSEKLRRGL
ncbi:hypothetical protein [Rhizobium wenxiniae]|uniref:hypothetical protein n=1 Tax=Rhizobium wenxiniae TaxID=1737357 RepID=UPI003C18812F